MILGFKHIKLLSLSFISIAYFCLSACATTHSSDMALTVEEALANSQMLDGSQVSVSGYLVLDFEDHNLYASRRDAKEKANNKDRCIALTINKDVYATWKNNDASFVVVDGTLNKDYCGPDKFCPYACNRIAIENIQISR